MGKAKFNVLDASRLFFPWVFKGSKQLVRVIKRKIVLKWSEGKQKLLRVSERFELSRVWVTEGKITVNVWRQSRGKRFWFEIARGSSYRESTVLATQITPTCTSDEQMIITTKLPTFSCEQILFLPCDIIQTSCFFFGGKKQQTSQSSVHYAFVNRRCFMLETPYLPVFFISFLLHAKIHFHGFCNNIITDMCQLAT